LATGVTSTPVELPSLTPIPTSMAEVTSTPVEATLTPTPIETATATPAPTGMGAVIGGIPILGAPIFIPGIGPFGTSGGPGGTTAGAATEAGGGAAPALSGENVPISVSSPPGAVPPAVAGVQATGETSPVIATEVGGMIEEIAPSPEVETPAVPE